MKALIDVVTMKPWCTSPACSPLAGCASWVSPLAWHPTNQNAVIMVDLTRDPTPLIELSCEEIRERLYTKKEELGIWPAFRSNWCTSTSARCWPRPPP